MDSHVSNCVALEAVLGAGFGFWHLSPGDVWG